MTFNKRNSVLGFVFSVLLVHADLAQDNGNTFVEVRSKYGFLAAHRGVMSHLPKQAAWAVEASYIRQNTGKDWERRFRMPQFGATAIVSNGGNDEILGHFIGAYGFIKFNWVKTPRFTWSGKLASGLSYSTKGYDPVDNPKNVAMSSPFDAAIVLGTHFDYSFQRSVIGLGIDMTHYSNGAFKMPNLGLNIPFVSVGYQYRMNAVPSKNHELIVEEVLRYDRWHYGVAGILSKKDMHPTGGKGYPVYALSGFVRYFNRPKAGWEFSLDVISKQAIFAYRPQIEKSQWDILQVGVFGGYVLPLDRLHFVLGMGYYIKDRYQPEDPMYHRIGLRYLFKNGVQVQTVLKSHWARADYVEWGIGYAFKR